MAHDREISRTVSFTTSQGATVRGTLHKLTRRSIVFEVYNPYLVFRTSEVLSEFSVRQGRNTLYQGDAVVTGVVSTSILLVISASLTDAWSELGDVPGLNGGLKSDAEDFINDWDHANRIDPDYRSRVADLRLFLNDLRFWLDQVDLAREPEPGGEANGETDGAKPSALNGRDFEDLRIPIMPRMTELFLGLEEASRSLDPEVLESHKQYAQRDLLPLMMPSPFFNRVYSKPLGYAGDYEMVNMMYRNKSEGQTTYAKMVDDWLLAGGPPQAHRNRIHMLERILCEVAEQSPQRNRPIRIMNVGCGPAQELQLFFSKLNTDHRFKIDLLDFNPETLDYARGKLATINTSSSDRPDVNYHLKSVQDLMRQAIERADAPEPYDFIYCAGLFDYLSDKVCNKLVRLFYHWCEPGGRVLVTNVHTSNPVKSIMEQLMEWHLVLRNETDMIGFSPDTNRSNVYGDPTGINVFLDILKPS